MKIRNKKTGAIYKIEDIDLGNNEDGIWLGMTKYNSLAELNEEWEDCEEPHYTYWIDTREERIVQADLPITDNCFEYIRELGLGFATQEEAEQAVEKLKAWKRLKDKGMKINDWKFTPDMAHEKGNFLKIEAEIPYIHENLKDLNLLFGGEKC